MSNLESLTPEQKFIHKWYELISSMGMLAVRDYDLWLADHAKSEHMMTNTMRRIRQQLLDFESELNDLHQQIRLELKNDV